MAQDRIVSLGGSLIVPDEINIKFLKQFSSIIKSSNDKFYVICGGGKTARVYMNAASNFIKEVDNEGIQSCLLNALFVQTILPKAVVTTGKIPHHSSDYDAVRVALNKGVKEVINLTNVDYVYSKNPKEKGAKPLKEISWDEYKEIIGGKWESGMHVPFDPLASKLAEKNGVKVLIIGSLKEFQKYLEGKKFKGSVIQ